MAFDPIYEVQKWMFRYENYKEYPSLHTLIQNGIVKNPPPTPDEYDKLLMYLTTGLKQSILGYCSDPSKHIELIITHHTIPDKIIVRLIKSNPQYPKIYSEKNMVWFEKMLKKGYQPTYKVIDALMKAKYPHIDNFISDKFTLNFLKQMAENDILKSKITDDASREALIKKCNDNQIVPDSGIFKKLIDYNIPICKNALDFLTKTGYKFKQADFMTYLNIWGSSYINSKININDTEYLLNLFAERNIKLTTDILLEIGYTKQNFIPVLVYHHLIHPELKFTNQTKKDFVLATSTINWKCEHIWTKDQGTLSMKDIIDQLYSGDIDTELMEWACTFNNSKLLNYCLEEGIMPTDKAMILACRSDNNDIVKILINHRIIPKKEHLYYIQKYLLVQTFINNGLQIDDDTIHYIRNKWGHTDEIKKLLQTTDIELKPLLTELDYSTAITFSEDIKMTHDDSHINRLMNNVRPYNNIKKEMVLAYHNIELTLDQIMMIRDDNIRQHYYSLYKLKHGMNEFDTESKASEVKDVQKEISVEVTKPLEKKINKKTKSNTKTIANEKEILKKTKKVVIKKEINNNFVDF